MLSDLKRQHTGFRAVRREWQEGHWLWLELGSSPRLSLSPFQFRLDWGHDCEARE